jgi:hypothetical protein
MTDRPLDDRHPSSQGVNDPTRDIRLPPLPGSTPAALPPEWSAAAQPAPSAVQASVPEPALPRVHDPVDDEPTDLLPPPVSPDRQRTLTFDSPAGDLGHGLGQPPFGSPGTAGPAPVLQPPAPVPAPPAARPDPHTRKWPWVLLVLLPLVVIVVAGLVLALLLGG